MDALQPQSCRKYLVVAAALVSLIVIAWVVTNATATPPPPSQATQIQPEIEPPPTTTIDSTTNIGEHFTDMNVRKNTRNVEFYDATERNPLGMVQHVGDLQIEQALRMRDDAKLDQDGMPSVSRPKFMRS